MKFQKKDEYPSLIISEIMMQTWLLKRLVLLQNTIR